MEKIKLKLFDILQLESEINGFVNQDGKAIYQGFIKQNLSILLKYELTELSEVLAKEKKVVESLRDDLIKKYGEEDGKGGILVKMFNEEFDETGEVVINRTVNENYIKFDEEYGVLLSNEKEIEYPEITKEDLKEAGKSNDDYKVLFRLIKREKKEE
jgi:hypothetical protein